MQIPYNSEMILNAAKAENSKNTIQGNPKSAKALDKATKDFEAVLLNMVLKSMWKTIPKSDLFEEDSSKEIYEGLMQSSLAEELASNGGMGVAKALYRQLSRQQTKSE